MENGGVKRSRCAGGGPPKFAQLAISELHSASHMFGINKESPEADLSIAHVFGAIRTVWMAQQPEYFLVEFSEVF